MGFLFPLFSGILLSVQNRFNRVLEKEKGINSVLVNFFRFMLAPWVLALVVFLGPGFSFPSQGFWLSAAVYMPAEIGLFWLLSRAFKHSEQSLVGPLYSVTPVLLIFSGNIFLKEAPSIIGIAGIVVSTIGALLLGWDITAPGVRRAISNIFKEKGTYYVLGASVCAAVTTTSAKSAFQYVSPIEFAFWISSLLFLSFGFWALGKNNFSQARGNSSGAVAVKIAGTRAIEFTLHAIGLSLFLTSYYTAIKRVGIIFDVLLGWRFGKEKRIREKFLGVAIMLIGVILVAIATASR